jgi:hypothetical protein
MEDLEMVPRKEHVTLDCYVKPMERVQYHQQVNIEFIHPFIAQPYFKGFIIDLYYYQY